MINNRQNGRRRGRGGGPRPPNNTPSSGNRQDNRQRGNAAQLHEKYKALARDAQLSGDRVQTEFYLQFADHYFRVLNEGRARFEEQRRQRDDYAPGEEEDQDEGMNAADGDERDDRDDSDTREDRDTREEREPREARFEGGRGYRNGSERGPRDQSRNQPRDHGRDQPRDQGQGRRQQAEAEARVEDREDEDERISLDVLPPAIASEEAEPARTPRRRTRRPRPDGDTEIAPAA